MNWIEIIQISALCLIFGSVAFVIGAIYESETHEPCQVKDNCNECMKEIVNTMEDLEELNISVHSINQALE